jgi:hypothetical protein
MFKIFEILRIIYYDGKFFKIKGENNLINNQKSDIKN